jgi:hypothetical protein
LVCSLLLIPSPVVETECPVVENKPGSGVRDFGMVRSNRRRRGGSMIILSTLTNSEVSICFFEKLFS